MISQLTSLLACLCDQMFKTHHLDKIISHSHLKKLEMFKLHFWLINDQND